MKYLLQHEPADFLRFGLDDRTVRILGAVPTALPALPARGRDVDGAYVIAWGAPAGADAETDAAEHIGHVEFHRRHQGERELGADIAEAQVRLFRREGKLVVSHLWDLYGHPDAPVREKKKLFYGAEGSSCVYQRINLRGMGWEQLLAEAPPTLWALVALTRDGATMVAIAKVRDAFEAHPSWSPTERSDHLTVLWFVSEAEGVPVKLLQAVLEKEKLMESELYREILVEGEAKATARGILAVLGARGISVSDAIRTRILGCSDVATLDAWIRRAAVVSTAAAVVRSKAPARGDAGPVRHAHKS
jgi:hypothetical protein